MYLVWQKWPFQISAKLLRRRITAEGELFQEMQNIKVGALILNHNETYTLNKLASLEATLVQNYDPATYSLSDGGEV